MINDVLARRFQELSAAFDKVPFERSRASSDDLYVKPGDWMRWATSAQSLIRAAIGENSPHYQNFVAAIEKCSGWDYEVLTLRGIFLSAKDDFDGGYIFNVDLTVSGEVFGDFVALARQSLAEGHKDVAAVLACAALEDCLKRYANVCGLNTQDKTMQEVVNALKSGGHVGGAQKTLLDTMPKIRNSALHADWAKITEPEVASVIGFVESFLLTKFAP
jgi:hypothetical protein